jgi:hypothetical protein
LAQSLVGLGRNGIIFLERLEACNVYAVGVLRCALGNESFVPITIDEWGVVRDEEVELEPFTMIAWSSYPEGIPTDLLQHFEIQLDLCV